MGYIVISTQYGGIYQKRGGFGPRKTAKIWKTRRGAEAHINKLVNDWGVRLPGDLKVIHVEEK